jgi:hypothetical protein
MGFGSASLGASIATAVLKVWEISIRCVGIACVRTADQNQVALSPILFARQMLVNSIRRVLC